SHSWPGNVRELANVIERAVINTKGSVLQVVDHFVQVPHELVPTQTLEEVERDYITRTLENTGWRIEGPYGAAKILGLNPSTLRTRMLKLGIQRPVNRPLLCCLALNCFITKDVQTLRGVSDVGHAFCRPFTAFKVYLFA